MVFIVLYPAVAFLAMIIVLVIMIMLRHGPRLCGLEHSIADRQQGYLHGDDKGAYDHRISVA